MQASATLSNTGFVVNMINLCIGMGLLAKPYAIYVAGWYSILSVMMAFSLISYTSYLLAKVTMKSYGINMDTSTPYQHVQDPSNDEYASTDDEILITDNEQSEIDVVTNNDENKSSTHKQSVFHVMAEKSLGKYGKYYVIFAASTILILICINIIIIEFDIISGIVANISSNSIPFYLQEEFIFIYIFLCSLPLIFVLNWKQLTIVGYISVISIIILVITMIYVFILCEMTFDEGSVPNKYFQNVHVQTRDTENTAQYAKDNMDSFQRTFVCFLIFKTGINGSNGLPPLIIAMKDKSSINILRVIFISYFIVTIFSISFGFIGASVYRQNVSVMILNNLFIWPGNVLVIIISIIKAVNLWASYSFILSNACDIMDGSLNIEEDMVNKRYLIRFLTLIFTLFIAYICRYYLALMTALISCFDSSVGFTLVLPLVLYIGMFYKEMSLNATIFHVLLTVFGIAAATFVIYSSIHGLL